MIFLSDWDSSFSVRDLFADVRVKLKLTWLGTGIFVYLKMAIKHRVP
jgi:hypothetical protein